MRRIIALGGGELKTKTTLEIDKYIAQIAKEHAYPNRAYGLFIGTASHDSMPYFNSFRKTYTSIFDIKADCALIVYGEMNLEKITEKFLKADFIYIGGGNTLFMLDKWRECGILNLILDAYNRGVTICGLSAGAICWFENMYTDSDINTPLGSIYSIHKGLGLLSGICSPHYNERINDFNETIIKNNYKNAYAIENNAALVFENEKLIGSLSSGGKAFLLRNNSDNIEAFEIDLLK